MAEMQSDVQFDHEVQSSSLSLLQFSLAHHVIGLFPDTELHKY